MLPDSRQDEVYAVPKFEIAPEDLTDLKQELLGFHENFSDCFQRSESRDHFFRYMAGQFAQLERKSIEPIALALEGGKIRAMQRFVSEAHWEEEKILRKYRDLVNEDLGHPDGALIFDESGFPKKAMTLSGLPNSVVAPLVKLKTVKLVFSRLIHHRMDTP
jgi:SRSO17 transposase